MTALTTILVGDLRLQARNGFYWAVAAILVCFAVLFQYLPAFDWIPVLPALVFGNLLVATFFFIGAMVLLEKSEGTLVAQLVTPLSVRRYFLSKVGTLTMLSIVESLLIIAIVGPSTIEWLPFLLGVGAAAVMYCLTGFLVVIRYDSINEYLFPTIAYTAALLLPVLDQLGFWQTSLMRLHPLDPALRLIAAGFEPQPLVVVLIAVTVSSGWSAVLLELSRRSFKRFVVTPPGSR